MSQQQSTISAQVFEKDQQLCDLKLQVNGLLSETIMELKDKTMEVMNSKINQLNNNTNKEEEEEVDVLEEPMETSDDNQEEKRGTKRRKQVAENNNNNLNGN